MSILPLWTFDAPKGVAFFQDYDIQRPTTCTYTPGHSGVSWNFRIRPFQVIRHAAQKHFDWFGGYVCGFAVAIVGGTIRDSMLGVRPFWMTDIMYVLCTALALLLVILSRKW